MRLADRKPDVAPDDSLTEQVSGRRIRFEDSGSLEDYYRIVELIDDLRDRDHKLGAYQAVRGNPSGASGSGLEGERRPSVKVAAPRPDHQDQEDRIGPDADRGAI